MNETMEFTATPPCPCGHFTNRGGWLGTMLIWVVLLWAARRVAAWWAFSNAFPNLTFDHPVGLYPETNSSRLYVTEWDGRIYSFTNSPSTSQKTLVLDLSAVTQSSNDCGLMGFVF